MGRVPGKTAIVTGGAMGMGAATVRRFAAEGASVVIADVNAEVGRSLAGELGGNTVFLELDVADPRAWAEVVKQTEERFGSVDILVNNAGIADSGPFEEWNGARLQRVLDVNLLGVFHGIQAVIPAMKRAGGGSIVNVVSVGGLQGFPMMSGYIASKWAARGLTKSVSLELGRYGIRVNAVNPGQIDTPMTSGVKFDTGNIALGRVGHADEIAGAILFLAGDDARFITGSEIAADGGQSAGQANYTGVPQ